MKRASRDPITEPKDMDWIARHYAAEASLATEMTRLRKIEAAAIAWRDTHDEDALEDLWRSLP